MRWHMPIFFLLLLACSQLKGAVVWTAPPTTLSTLGQNATEPHIVTDPAGNLVCAWIENGSVVAQTKLSGGNWSQSVTLSGGGASSLSLVSDPTGKATATWLEGGLVKATSKALAGNWSAATTLSAAGSSSPRIAVDPSGNLVVAWSRAGNIESKTKLAGQSWQPVANTIGSSSASSLQVTIGSQGTVAIVWRGTLNSMDVVYISTKAIGLNIWSSPQAISNTSIDSDYPQVTIDGENTIFAIWYQYTTDGSLYQNLSLQFSSLPDGGSWSTPLSLSSSGILSVDPLVSKIDCDNNGNLFVAWQTSCDGSNFDIFSTTRNSEGLWASPICYELRNRFAYAFDADTDSSGHTLIASMRRDTASSLIIQTAQMGLNNANRKIWSLPKQVSTGTSNAYPSITVATSSGHTTAAIAWLAYNGANTLVNVVTGEGNDLLPATNLAISQSSFSLGFATEYINTLTWSATLSPSIEGYLIFRGDTLVATLPPTQLQFIDNNQAQNGPVTYSVVAYTVFPQYEESPAATISFP
jgi:hypothetical protein